METGALAREYVRLGLRCDRLLTGLVDAYTGDLALRREVLGEPRPYPAELAKQARSLRAAVLDAELSERRRDFLERQLVAVECAMNRLAGQQCGFRAELGAYFDVNVQFGDSDRYRAAHTALADVLPGGGPLAARMAAYRKREEIPAERIGPAVQALSAALRKPTRRQAELPDGEAVYYEFTTNRPWSAFNHYLGDYRSRVVVNVDVAGRASALPQLVAHEAYPGHHAERCRREAGPVRRDGCLEQAIFLLNTPQCVLSEGLAELALPAVVGPAWGRWAQAVLAELNVWMDGELAERVETAMAGLLEVRQDAALLLHDRGASQDEVIAYLGRWLLVSEPRARQMLRFLVHPLWRAYLTSYVEGRRLVLEWLAARPAGEPTMVRFRRLMDEPFTPAALRAELTSGSGSMPGPADRPMKLV